MRTLVAAMAALGLVAAITVMPAAAQTCAAADATAELVTDHVTLSFDSEFTCTDAVESGSWSIVVDVSNDSDAEVTIEACTLSHVTPSVHADAAGGIVATADATGLPLTLAAGAAGSFEVDGDYTLAQVGSAGLANLHLRATGIAAGDEVAPFTLGINVHLLGPGAELDEADAGAAAGAGGRAEVGTEGQPEWAPGPPPWVRDLLATLFADGFPWGTDAFPPAGDVDVEAGAGAQVEAGAAADAAAGTNVVTDAGAQAGPPHIQLPAPAASAGAEGDAQVEARVEVDAGAPDWVPAPPFGGP